MLFLSTQAGRTPCYFFAQKGNNTMSTTNNTNPNASTGPTTPEGKFQSSRNAISHGLTAANIDRLPESIRDAFRTFLDEQYAEWQPVTSNECLYLERYVFAQFQLTRANLLLTSALEACMANPTDADTKKHHAQMQRHTRALERSSKEAIAELRLLISDRMASAGIESDFLEKTDTVIGIPPTYPSHRLLETKDIKLNTQGNALRFVKEQYHRYQTHAANANSEVEMEVSEAKDAPIAA